METIIDLQPYDWDVEQERILCWCLDKKSDKHLVRFEDFPSFCFISLPDYVGGQVFKWDSSAASKFYDFLCFRLKRENEPYEYEFTFRQDLYYYQGLSKKPFMKVYFRKAASLKALTNLLSKNVYFRTRYEEFGDMRATVCETEISKIRKLITQKKVKYSGWLRFTGYNPLSEEDLEGVDTGESQYIVKDALGNLMEVERNSLPSQISRYDCTNEWICDWEKLESTPEEEVKGIITQPNLLGFDLEAYSDKHRVFPNENNVNNVTFMNSCVFQVSGKPETKEKYVLVKGRVFDIPESKLKNCTVIPVTEQLDLYYRMGDLIVEKDVDIITGYNILNFDFRWADSKFKQSAAEWPDMGRLIKSPTYMPKPLEWSSGAYGFNSIYNLICPGRIFVDMLPIIRRDYKLNDFRLNTVADHFLKRGKHDVTPEEMFVTYERNEEACKEYDRCFDTGCADDKIPVCVESLLPPPETTEESEESLRTFASSEGGCGDTILELERSLQINERRQNNLNLLCREDVISQEEYDKKMSDLIKSQIQIQDNLRLSHEREDYGPGGERQKLFDSYVKVNERSNKSIDEYSKEVFENEAALSEDPSYFHDSVKAVLDRINDKLNKYVEFLEKPETYERWKSNYCRPDSVNDSMLGPKYNRFKAINYCSDDLWKELRTIARNACHTSEEMPGILAKFPTFSSSIIGNLAAAMFLMTRVAVYCLIDSDICIDLFDHLNTWVGLIEMSAVAGVTVTELFTRGQQIRCLSQLYDEATNNEIILTTRELIEIAFNGGFVFDVKPGLFDRTGIVDFNSLYPSIMKQFNICYTTLLRPEHFEEMDEEYVNTVNVIKPGMIDDDGAQLDMDHDEDEESDDEDEESDDEGDNENEEVAKDTPKKKRRKTRMDREGEKLNKIFSGVYQSEKYYHFRFVKREVKEGLLPAIVRRLVNQRKAVRKEQNSVLEDGETPRYPKGSVTWTIFEKRQLALKVMANSMYGFLGTKKGRRPLIEGAMCITALGRQLIQWVNKKIEDDYDNIIRYGDTDSSMPQFPEMLPENLIPYGDKMAKELSDHLPEELNLELEKVMKMLCVCKKKYGGYVYGKDGKFVIDPKTGQKMLYIRGLVLARRDNAPYLLELYEKILRAILDDAEIEEIFDILFDHIQRLVEGKVDYTDLITIKSVKANYKQKNCQMALFYKNMNESGKLVQPGDRVSYLVVKKTPFQGLGKKYIGNRMILPEMYEESKQTDNPYEIDYLYYLENQFSTALDQLIRARFATDLKMYSEIEYKKKRERKYRNLQHPVAFIAKIMNNSFDLSELKESMAAVKNGNARGASISRKHEANGFSYTPKKNHGQVGKKAPVKRKAPTKAKDPSKRKTSPKKKKKTEETRTKKIDSYFTVVRGRNVVTLGSDSDSDENMAETMSEPPVVSEELPQIPEKREKVASISEREFISF